MILIKVCVFNVQIGNNLLFFSHILVSGSDTLKIGDLVLLKDVVRGCTLSVEGILDDDMCGSKGLLSLHDSLFCVHLQRQYSASRDLNAFLDSIGDVRNIKDDSILRYLAALEVCLVLFHEYVFLTISNTAWSRKRNQTQQQLHAQEPWSESVLHRDYSVVSRQIWEVSGCDA